MHRLQFTCLLGLLIVIATGVWLPRIEALAIKPAAPVVPAATKPATPPALSANEISVRYSSVMQTLYFVIKDSATVPDQVNALDAESRARRWLECADEVREKLKDTPLVVYGTVAAEIFRQTGMQWRHCRQQLAKGGDFATGDKKLITMLTGQAHFMAEDLLLRTR